MLIDIHIHTSNVSRCGKVPADEVVRLYKENTGCGAIVVTDHINESFLNAAPNNDPEREDWQDTVTRHMAGYKLAKKAGDNLGIRVFYGCELRFDTDPNDYLVYGMSEGFMRSHPHLNRMTIKEFSPLARENGILVYQAHPFRDGMNIVNPEKLFGVEVGNGHERHNSRNDFATFWADCNGLHKIAGSDFHWAGDEGHGGIVTANDIETYDELLDVLRDDKYLLAVATRKGF